MKSRYSRGTSLALAAIAMSIAGSAARAGTTEALATDKVPAAIMAAAVRAVPGFAMERAQVETEGDKRRVFELIGKDADAQPIEIDVFENGRIEEIERPMPVDEVPGAVIGKLQGKFPGCVVTLVEASYSPAGKVIGYEFEATFEGKKLDLEVSADGSRIVEADA